MSGIYLGISNTRCSSMDNKPKSVNPKTPTMMKKPPFPIPKKTRSHIHKTPLSNRASDALLLGLIYARLSPVSRFSICARTSNEFTDGDFCGALAGNSIRQALKAATAADPYASKNFWG